MSKAELLEKLKRKEYRDSLVSEEIDIGLPMQLREMRESRGWKQGDVAEKIGTQQPRFSVMEKLGYGNYSLNTLKKLASVFDVALVVSFVPYSDWIDFIESLSFKRLAIPEFSKEYAKLARRYDRVQDKTEAAQLSLDFMAGTSNTTKQSAANAPATEQASTDLEVQFPELKYLVAAAGGRTDAPIFQ